MAVITNPLDENQKEMKSAEEPTEEPKCISCKEKTMQQWYYLSDGYCEDCMLKKRKFDEILGIAEKLFVNSLHFDNKEGCFATATAKGAWEEAEKFYEYAKQKLEEMLNGDA
jgi:hypothetical protein